MLTSSARERATKLLTRTSCRRPDSICAIAAALSPEW
jgi:hypothetical protein